MSTGPEIQAAPRNAPLDTDITIRLRGFLPSSVVAFTATLTADGARTMRSSAFFMTDKDGTVDLGSSAPVAGSYHVADANGPIWSMEPVDDWVGAAENPLLSPRPFRSDDLDAYDIQFDAVSSGVRAHTSIRRTVLGEGVRSIEVDDSRLVGRLFLPPGRGPHPTLIQWGGSGGGVQLRRAALYAGHGVATLALGYFRVPGTVVPPTLERVPVEYIERALAWLREQPDLVTDHVGVAGTSRGGELALLAASLIPDLWPVVAWVPSAYAWGEHAQPGADPRGTRPSWTWRGQDIPFIAPTSDPQDFLLRDGVSSHSLAFLRSIERAPEPEQARIAVERIAGPVLLVGGEDDALWPSGWFVREIAADARRRGFTHPLETWVFPEAGHAISIENEPTTFLALGSDTSGSDRGRLIPDVTDTFHYGGTPQGTAAANREMRSVLWRFLRENLLDSPSQH